MRRKADIRAMARAVRAGGRPRLTAARTAALVVGALLFGLGAAGGPRPAAAQAVVPNCTADAPHSLSAVYRICMPAPGRWNGSLVIYAHGYVSAFEPVGIPEDQLQLGDVNLPKLITDLGFAFATTSYSGNGLVIPQAVADVADLVPLFTAFNAGQAPKRVYLVGPSEGGIVTAKAIESHGELFDGGVSACGPIGDFRRQINYLGDFRVIFDYFFPGLIPGSPVAIPPEVVADWETVYVPAIVAAVTARPDATRQLLRVTGAPVDPSDPSTTVATIVDVLWYNVFGTNDARSRLNGQPFDNRTRWYFGSDNDLLLNLRVQRFSAEAAALQTMAEDFETSGRPPAPLVLMHTTGDPIMRFWNQPAYVRKAREAGFGDQLIALPIIRYGHCQFKPVEALLAFALMILKVEGAEPFDAEQVLPTAEARAEYRTRLDALVGD